jgi:hypothetical protein
MSASSKGLGTSRLRTGPRRDLDSEAYEQALSVTVLVDSVLDDARRYVKRQAHDEADEQGLLSALGLL